MQTNCLKQHMVADCQLMFWNTLGSLADRKTLHVIFAQMPMSCFFMASADSHPPSVA